MYIFYSGLCLAILCYRNLWKRTNRSIINIDGRSALPKADFHHPLLPPRNFFIFFLLLLHLILSSSLLQLECQILTLTTVNSYQFKDPEAWFHGTNLGLTTEGETLEELWMYAFVGLAFLENVAAQQVLRSLYLLILKG